MARTISSPQIRAVLSATLNNSIDGGAQGATCAQGKTFTPATTLSNGTGANQADTVWGDSGRALSSAATENIDVFDLGSINIDGGAGKDSLGQAVANVEIVGILIHHESGTGTLLVGGEGSAATWNSLFNSDDDAKAVVKPGGFMMFSPPEIQLMPSPTLRIISSSSKRAAAR